MTEVATPEPAVQRGCPRCGAPLADDQEWCLACGTAVSTRVAPTPRWRAPVALVGALVVLLAASLALALVELSRDPQPVAKAPQATPAPTAAATAAPTATTTPSATPTPTPTPTAGKGGSSQTSPNTAPGASVAPSSTTKLADWPGDRTAWTVVLASAPSRAAANRSARRLVATAKGAPVGVLDPNRYPSLGPGAWTVFAGQFSSRALAAKAAQEIGGVAYARRIVPG